MQCITVRKFKLALSCKFTDSFFTCKKDGPNCDVFVHFNCRIKRNKATEPSLSQISDSVPTHGDQKGRVGEHHCRGGSSSNRHSVASNPAQT